MPLGDKVIEKAERLDGAMKMLAQTMGTFHGINDKAAGKNHSFSGAYALNTITFDLIHLCAIRAISCRVGNRPDDATIESILKDLSISELRIELNERYEKNLSSLSPYLRSELSTRMMTTINQLLLLGRSLGDDQNFYLLKSVRDKQLAHSTLGAPTPAQLRHLWKICRDTLKAGEALGDFILLKRPAYFIYYRKWYQSARELTGHMYRGSTIFKAQQRSNRREHMKRLGIR